MTPPSAPSTRGDDGRRMFGLFSFLLALSLILHRLWWNGFEVEGLHFLVVLAAFWALLGPTSLPRFLTMLGAAVASVAVDMPNVGDHTLLVGVVGACVLSFVAATVLRRRRLLAPGELFERIAPFLRAAVIVVYAAAALAKMNGTFLDPSLSCAATMSSRLAWFDPSLLAGSWPVAPAIWSTVIIEASLPVLLAIPRTRVAGLVLGVGFHLVLALAGNVPFTAVVLAFYVAFLSPDLPGRARAALLARRELAALAAPVGGKRRFGESVAFLGLIGCWLSGALLESADPSVAEALIAYGTRLLVVAVVLAAGFTALLVRRGSPGAKASSVGSLRVTHPILALGIVLLVANAAAPYLGLKTSTSFNMFSNLRTEQGYWNHAFVPEGVRIFGYQDELVRVVASNDAYLRDQGREGYLLVRFELGRYLRQHPGTVATYTSATPGSAPQITVRSTPRPGSGLAGPPSAGAIVDEVARFQPVPPPGRPGC